MEYRDAKFTADGRIDCEIEHPRYGWIPFTASDDDAEPHGRDLFARIVADDAAAPYVPPAAPAPTPDQVRAEGARRLAAIAADYSPEERETWAVQVDEARAVLADPGAPTPMLAPLAAARGLSIAEMAGVVLTKAGGFAAASGAILAAQSILIGTDPIPADYAADHYWPSSAA